jgi:hypothetical protein
MGASIIHPPSPGGPQTHTHTYTHNLQATFTPSLYYTESKDEALMRTRCAPLLYAETGVH